MSRKTIRTRATPGGLDRRIATSRRDAIPAGVTRDSDRADAGWGNIMMGLADMARDKREWSTPLAERHTYGELMELYRGNDMAARMVDRPVDDMTREGFETSIDAERGGVKDPETVGDDVDGAAEELGVVRRIAEAMKKCRASGGGAILIGAVDGVGDPAMPLNEAGLKRIDFLTVLDAREIYPTSYYSDPFAPKFGLPRTYRVQPAIVSSGSVPDPSATNVATYAFRHVHESRVVRFEGVNVNRWQMRETLGWGDSMLERPWKVLRNHDLGWDAASYLLTDFAQAVFKMKGLADAVRSGNSKLVQDRAAIMEMQRSFMRMVMIGEDDEFERKPTPLSGLPDMLDRFAKRLAASGDIPVEILYGESPAGLNATGSNTVRNYYDRIKSKQREDVQPALRYLLRLLFLSKAGPTRGKLPKTWSVTFRPLWQPTEGEIAEAYAKFAAGDTANVNSGVLEPEEIAISRFGGRRFGTYVRIDTKGREKFLRENPPGEHTEREAAEESAATEVAKATEKTAKNPPKEAAPAAPLK